jgi:outer membrane protein assembly factor BamB
MPTALSPIPAKFRLAQPQIQLALVKLALVKLALAALLLSGPVPAAFGQNNWNRFRGENGRGVVARSHVPLPWSEGDVAWRAQLPGEGNGSPIIQNHRVFIQSADPESAERHVLAYDLLTGEELWARSYPSQPHAMHARSSYASSTPCADDSAVYVAWGAPDGVLVKAFTHDGEELWTRNLGRFVGGHGFGGSPMLFDGKLIVLNSQDAEELPPGVAPGQTEVVALDPATGETIWSTPRTTTRVCYGVPAAYRDSQGRDVLVMNETGDGFFGLEANTGRPLWNRKAFTKRCVSSPLVVGDLIFGSEGSGGGGNIVFAINTARNQEVAFDIRGAEAPYVPTPVAKDDLLFLWSDKGIASAVELPSGKLLWSKRIGGDVSASPIILGEHLIGIAEDGTATILAAAREFQEIGKVKLGETTRATPAAREDCLLLRTASQLICVGQPNR